MIVFLVTHVFSLLLDLICLRGLAGADKDVESLLLRQQLRILQRKQPHPPRISRWEKLTLVVLAGKLTTLTSRAREVNVVSLPARTTKVSFSQREMRGGWGCLR